MDNEQTTSSCAICKFEISACGYSKGFTSPEGRRLCFTCFINYSVKNSDKHDENSPSPILCSSIEMGSPGLKDNLPLHKMNFTLEPCSKHIWTELKTQKLYAYSYCTVCDVSICSVCLLSTPHRYHETLQLSELFSSIEEVPSQVSASRKTANADGALGKVAQRVITLLSTPPSGLEGAIGSSSRQTKSPLNNTSEGKSLFLLDVLNKDQKKSPFRKEPQIKVFSIEESQLPLQAAREKKSMTRKKSPLTVNTSIYQPNQTLQKSQRQFKLMSPLVKTKNREMNSPAAFEYYKESEPKKDACPAAFSIYKPSQTIKPKGHTKTTSLIPSDILENILENKENVAPGEKKSAKESKKAIKRVLSSSKTSCETPRQRADLSSFSLGIQKAFGTQTGTQTAKHFVLTRMGISKENINQLIEMLKNYKVSQIDLSHNSLTDGCLPPLASLFKDQSIKVDLRGNLLTPNAVALFKQACQKCSVLH
jgi:hypothetical protein